MKEGTEFTILTSTGTEEVQYWEPTCEIVWVKECGNPFTTSYTLKQKWISNKRTSELRDVPVVDDLDNTTNEP